MILNTGGRTDTVQYYAEWLLNRFSEGYVFSRNPICPNIVNRIELDPETIDVVVFCSKNYAPILDRLSQITSHFRCYFHYTITAYDADIEPFVPSVEESIDTLKRLAEQVGADKIAWRYDPILLTEKYTISHHIETFDRMASELVGYVSRCIFSFVDMYRKLEINMPELRSVSAEDKSIIAKELSLIAHKHGLSLQTCATTEMYDGIQRSGCMTTEIFEKAFDITFKRVQHRGNRAGCQCMESRGLGDYNSCPNGCRYCYANKDHTQALRNYQKLHDPASPLLLGHVLPTDIIKPIRQNSMLTRERRLF